MGFRKDAYATVWQIEPATDTRTKGRISVSRKNKQTGEYETDFSGFVDFIGTAAAQKALTLKEKDRIKLGDVDVTTNYVKEKNITYTNYKVFNFEIQGGMATNENTEGFASFTQEEVDSGILDDSQLPF